jgi:transposase-like protein
VPTPHPPEFRRRAIELARERSKSFAELAKDLRISESCLRNWEVSVPRGEAQNRVELIPGVGALAASASTATSQSGISCMEIRCRSKDRTSASIPCRWDSSTTSPRIIISGGASITARP